MNASPTVYSFADLVAGLGLSIRSASASGNTTTTVGSTLPLPAPAIAAVRSRSLVAACAGLVNIKELKAAAPYVRFSTDYKSWLNEWMLPIATAIAYAPQYEPELRKFFDQGNRRNADPTKASEEYFAKAQQALTNTIAGRDFSRPKIIGLTKIFQNAAQNGWPGAAASTTVVKGATAQPFGPSTSFFSPLSFDPADLHRPFWIASGLLLREEISVLAGPGGGAKTASAFMLAVACAAGSQFGSFRIEGQRPGGLRVAYISAEENSNSAGLLVAAACRVLALNAAERALVTQNLTFHDAAASGWRLGEPKPGSRNEIAPENEDWALNQLTAALTGIDILILDTLAALFALPDENDNQAITALMRRLAKAARATGCAVLVLHHTPKMTKEQAAAQRGEVTLVRGGSAIVNSSRVVLTLTSLPDGEAAQFAMMGFSSDRTRRLEHSKLNDGPFMAPAYLALRPEPVTVADGSEVAVRAIEFIAAPAASGPATNALHNLVMRAIQAGAIDKHGARVPLSPGGGASNERDGIQHIANALMTAQSSLTEAQAKKLAKDTLKTLQKLGYVTVDQEAKVPRYKLDGQRDGSRKVSGLVCQWHLVPWLTQQSTDAPEGVKAASEGGGDA
jgi:hypothetical protein